MIISVLNLKGGAGKTTVATNLVYALGREQTLLLIDTDQQRSAMRWFACRENKNDNFAAISITEPAALKKQIPIFQGQYDHIVIDGAPQTDMINAVSIFLSDLIVIPVNPSPYDLWATEEILSRIKTAQEMKSIQACFVLNRVNEKAALTKDAIAALESLDLPVLSTRLANRIVYADSAATGLSVLESDNRKAKSEFTNLVNEIKLLIR